MTSVDLQDRSPLVSPACDAARVLRRLRAHLPQIQSRALALDRGESFPHEDLGLLGRIGALSLFAEEGASPEHLLEALRLTGRANLSLGRILEGHVNAARLIRLYGDDAQRRVLAHRLQEGRVFGVWNTQPSPGVDMVETDSGKVLRGVKSYATGAGHIDFAVVTATAPCGGRQMVIADAADAARADTAAWRTRGMKASLSGTYDLTGLPIDRETRLGRIGDYLVEPVFSAGAWRFTAVQLGGVERVLLLMRVHLVSSPAAEDPLQRARFAEAVVAARSAYLWVREAAIRAEAPNASAEAIALVLLTRGVVEDAGHLVMEAAARCVGTRAFFSDNPLDLATRDLALYLRQPVPDQARDRAATAYLASDCWTGDSLW
jgi:alkylation response protein AidB-like acyl-CoA dehydrogenase